MVQELNARVTNANVIAAGQAVLNAFDTAVLAEWSTNAYSDAHGITIYQVDTASQKDAYYYYYRGLDFAVSTHWDEFLEAYAK